MKIEDKKEEFLLLIWENSIDGFERRDAENVFDYLADGPLKDIQAHIDEQAATIEHLKEALFQIESTTRNENGGLGPRGQRLGIQ